MKALASFLSLFLFLNLHSQSSFTVLFDFDTYGITPVTRFRLDSFLSAQKNNIQVLQIDLHGHCDSKGPDEYNNRLSIRRVAAVKNYLTGNGMPASNIINEKGHGKKELINENKTEEERLLNRRVTISFTTIIKQAEEIKASAPVTKNTVTLKEKLADSSLIAGSNIVLQNINFVGGSHQFLPQSKPMLEELLEAMQLNPRLVIRVEGHICCLQYPGDGLDIETGINNLSEARARAVKDYLVANNIAAERVSYKGFGRSAPIFSYPEKTEEERIQNRRVEIKIISR